MTTTIEATLACILIEFQLRNSLLMADMKAEAARNGEANYMRDIIEAEQSAKCKYQNIGSRRS